MDVSMIRATVKKLHEAQQSLEALEQELTKEGGAIPGNQPGVSAPPLSMAELEEFVNQLNDAELAFFREELEALLCQVEATRQLEADLLDAGVL